MVATQNQTRTREAVRIGKLLDIGAKLRRGHAGVATKLIHLIGRRLDQQWRGIGLRNLHRGHEHLLLAAAHAVQANRLSVAVCSEQRVYEGHGGSPGLQSGSEGLPCQQGSATGTAGITKLWRQDRRHLHPRK